MEEPSLRDSRLAIVGGLAAILIVGGVGFMFGREAASPPTLVEPGPPTIVPAQQAAVQIVETPSILDRRDLLALAASAADAAASGQGLPGTVRDAAGRRFDMRVPFGCDGPALTAKDAPMRWRHDPEEGVLRVSVAPIAWGPQNWWGATMPEDVEAVEGYWIARPWTTSEACPPRSDPLVVSGAEPGTLAGETLALVQFFANEGGRQARRDGRPFTVVQRMNEPPASFADGLRLRLRGRIADGPDTHPIRCNQPGGSQQRPICAVAIEMDQVAIEDAEGAVLGSWDVGQPATKGD